METLRSFSDYSLQELIHMRKSVYDGPLLEKAIETAIASGRRHDAISFESYFKISRQDIRAFIAEIRQDRDKLVWR